MKNRFIVIYTVFAAAVFIFSISFFGYNLYSEYSTNLEKSDTKFNELVANLKILSTNYEENSEVYSNAVKKAINDPLNFSYIHVRRNNETVVLYPTGKSKAETISKLTKSYDSSITVNRKVLTVDCNYYLIRPDSIFYYARISFLMILIITIITIIMIIYLNLTENSSDVISLEEDTTDDISEDEETEVYTDESSEEAAEETSQTDTEETSETATTENHGEIENYYSEDAFENDEEPEASSSEVTPEEVKAIFAEPLTDEQAQTAEAKLPVDEIKPAETNEPSGLYNPQTGIGWESYLSTRLNNEIDRATASEIDLSLFIIKLSGIEKSNEMFKNVCNYLAIQFQFKDLLFEYKEDCIVAIKISMNVDEALTLAEKLYNDISNIVNNKDSRIGISSRSIRMVGGDRLILEAEQAIEHSDSAAPVIAFRVDSEKYRKLMEQNQKN